MKSLIFPLLALMSCSTALTAASVIWSDDFSGSQLNSYFTKYRNYLDIDIAQSGGQLVVSSSRAANFAAAYAVTSTDQNGVSSADGASMYNFFHRPIAVTITDPIFSGGLTSGVGYNFFVLLGTPSGGDIANLNPRSSMSGAYARLFYNPGGAYSLEVGDRVIGGGAVGNTMALSGAPTAFTLTLNGTEWQVDVVGTTFSATGMTSVSGTLAQIVEGDLAGSTYFSLGTIQSGNLNAASVPYDVAISSLLIEEVQIVPEPDVTMLLGVGIIAIGLRSWRQRKIVDRE